MRLFFCSSITALFIGICGGCAAVADSDRGRFDRIAEHLDTGGTFYSVSTTRSLESAVEKIFRDTEKSFWHSEMPDEGKLQAQRLLAQGEILSSILGLNEIKGWGLSSKQLPGKGVQYRNRGRLLLTENPKGVLWNLFASGDTDLSGAFRNLPCDTFAAGAANLTPAVLIRLFDADKNIAELCKHICNLLFRMSPETALQEMSGVWQAVVVCDEENNTDTLTGVHIAVTVPDKEGKLFQALTSTLKLFPGTRVDLKEGSIKLERIQNRMCIPYIRKGKGCFTLYTSPNAFYRTTDFNSFPQINQALLKKASLKGVAALYSANNSIGINFRDSIDTTPGKPALSVLKKDSRGFTLNDLSPCDLNASFFNFAAVLPLQLFFDYFSAPPENAQAPAPRAPAPKKAAPAPRKAPKAAPVSCTSQISRLGKLLMTDVKTQNKWLEAGISGMRVLAGKKGLRRTFFICPLTRKKPLAGKELSYADCHYLYFGKPMNNSPKTPVLMEHPALHRTHFSVFYADGSVENIQLSGQRNTRRAVSFLHTRHSYDEEEFMRLMQLAGEFDKILEL